MSLHDLQSLAPAQRTELIYRAARAGLDQQLWEAALGQRTDKSPSPQPNSARTSLSLEALVAALSAEDRIAPRLAVTPPIAPAAPSVTAGELRLGANAVFGPALERAAARTGLDPALLAAIVDAEAARRPDGRWDPASRNPRSTASGLGQFLAGTWLDEARRPGGWLAGEASARGWIDPGGHVRDEAKAALLALRFDPEASIQDAHRAWLLAYVDRRIRPARFLEAKASAV
jgi:hypothetical protein